MFSPMCLSSNGAGSLNGTLIHHNQGMRVKVTPWLFQIHLPLIEKSSRVSAGHMCKLA